MTHEYGPTSRTAARDDGMTLRDYFAGQALIETASWDYGNDWGKRGIKHAPKAAAAAYELADAMLKARGDQS